MAQRHFAGIDIGSKSIKVVIGELRKRRSLAITHAFKVPSLGIRKGTVDDISDVAQSLSPALAEVKKLAPSALAHLFVGVGGADIRVQSSSGVVAVSRADFEIYQDDIARAVQSAQAVNLPANRLVLHSIVREYIVDGVRDIADPLEMVGNRLEVSSLIIDAFAPAIKNASKCVEMLGGGVSGLILTPLADARAVLSKNQRELGVVLIDIGFGKTSICVYEEGKLLHTAIFPVGSGNVTNDLAIGLKVPVETAEQVKLAYGSAVSKEVASRDTIDLSKMNPKVKGTVSKRFIAEIIEVRLAEIFEFINNELKSLSKAARLPAGAVLVGGGAKVPGIVTLAKSELKLSAQIGVFDAGSVELRSAELAATLEDPEFTCATGLLLWGYDKHLESGGAGVPLSGLLRRIVRYLAP